MCVVVGRGMCRGGRMRVVVGRRVCRGGRVSVRAVVPRGSWGVRVCTHQGQFSAECMNFQQHCVHHILAQPGTEASL